MVFQDPLLALRAACARLGLTGQGQVGLSSLDFAVAGHRASVANLLSSLNGHASACAKANVGAASALFGLSWRNHLSMQSQGSFARVEFDHAAPSRALSGFASIQSIAHYWWVRDTAGRRAAGGEVSNQAALLLSNILPGV